MNDINQRIGKNIYELKLGLDGKINEQLSVFADVSGQKGSHKYKQIKGQLGIRYLF